MKTSKSADKKSLVRDSLIPKTFENMYLITIVAIVAIIAIFALMLIFNKPCIGDFGSAIFNEQNDVIGDATKRKAGLSVVRLTINTCGKGTVIGNSGQTQYYKGQSVTLIAVVGEDRTFNGWNVEATTNSNVITNVLDAPSNAPCTPPINPDYTNPKTIIMDSDKIVTAYFTPAAVGDSCTNNYECGTGICGYNDANPNQNVQVCSEGLSGISVCMHDNQCVSGKCSVNNKCVTTTGGGCTTNYECASGLCGKNGMQESYCFGTGDLQNGASCRVDYGGYFGIDASLCQSGYCSPTSEEEIEGYCSDGSVGEKCYYRQDCTSGFCDKLNHICKADASLGTGCVDGSNDCYSGYCNTLLTQGNGGYCSSGISGIDDCYGDEECQSGICGPYNMCVNSDGSSCTKNNECEYGYCGYDIAEGGNRCTAGLPGDPCAYNWECQSNICKNGLECVETTIGDPCNADSDCSDSGICYEGLCAEVTTECTTNDDMNCKRKYNKCIINEYKTLILYDYHCEIKDTQSGSSKTCVKEDVICDGRCLPKKDPKDIVVCSDNLG